MIRHPETPPYTVMPPAELPPAGVPSLLVAEIDADLIAVAPTAGRLAKVLVEIMERQQNGQ